MTPKNLPSTLTDLIRETEELAADAVPAAVVEALDGWRLRFNYGVKLRPNSVLANRDEGTVGLEAKLIRAEAFYAAHGLKARFQLSPASLPTGLDEALALRGYRRRPDPVCVQVVLLDRVWGVAEAVTLLERPNAAVLALCSDEGSSALQQRTLRAMLGQLPGEAVFALAHTAEGRPAATGIGVAHGGRLGLFNIATHPLARRQGLASAVVTALLRWGQAKALSGAYLQVSAGNTGAQAVYERLHFRTLYGYFYREQV